MFVNLLPLQGHNGAKVSFVQQWYTGIFPASCLLSLPRCNQLVLQNPVDTMFFLLVTLWLIVLIIIIIKLLFHCQHINKINRSSRMLGGKEDI